MPHSNIVPLWARNAAAAQAELRAIAQDSARVRFTEHARKRMRQRHITTMQVLRCLRFGTVVEGPAPTIQGNWELTVEVLSAGDVVRVAAAIDQDAQGHYVIIVTVYYS